MGEKEVEEGSSWKKGRCGKSEDRHEYIYIDMRENVFGKHITMDNNG